MDVNQIAKNIGHPIMANDKPINSDAMPPITIAVALVIRAWLSVF